MEDGVYDDGDGVYDDEEDGVYEDEEDGVYEDGRWSISGDGVYEEEDGSSVDGVYDEEGVDANVIGDGGVSGKKRVGYVSANNPSLHDNKIYCAVFHKTVHIIFFSFSSFIF